MRTSKPPIGTAEGDGWHDRGYMPHFESPDAIQHVTYRLADSLPKSVCRRLAVELAELPRERQEVERRRRIQTWLDAGWGSCLLREPTVAALVQTNFLHFHAVRYDLFVWVVMPNHVHVLFRPLHGWSVAKIVASWNRYTGVKIGGYRRAHPEIVDAETFDEAIWYREHWDRYMRDEVHFQQARAYIHQNPVKAGLVARAEDWRWSSAFVEAAKPVS